MSDRSHSPAALANELQALDPAECGNRLREVVTTWLSAEDLPHEELEPEEGIAWRLVVQVSDDWSVQIVHPTGAADSIVVGTGTILNEYHRDRIRAEAPEERRVLNQQLRDALHSELVERSYEFEEDEEGTHGLASVPQAFRIRKRIYADGLTKNRFFETITRVHSVRIQGVTTIQARYGTSDQPLDPMT